MADSNTLDAFAGWSLVGIGAVAVYAAWNDVEGGAVGLIKDAIRTGHVKHNLTKSTAGITTPSDDVAGGVGIASDKAQAAVSWGLTQVGKPYRWGATGPDAYDCSGFAQACYKHVGVYIPRTTYIQMTAGKPIHGEPIAGDLLFPDPGHVMVAIGDGTAVEAPHTGDFVKVVPIGGMRFVTVRRIIPAKAVPVSGSHHVGGI